jgi:hypothetical protein
LDNHLAQTDGKNETKEPPDMLLVVLKGRPKKGALTSRETRESDRKTQSFEERTEA